jgi:hypothetical protein
MSAMTMAVAVDAVTRFELPLLAGIIGYLPRGSLLIVSGPLWSQAGKEFDAAHTHEAHLTISKTQKLARPLRQQSRYGKQCRCFKDVPRNMLRGKGRRRPTAGSAPDRGAASRSS